MSTRHRYLFLFLACALFASCKKGIPSEVIQPDSMEALLYDYHIAQAIGNEYNGEERYKKELLIQYVFKKHHTTQADFDSSLVWYSRNTEELNKIYERVGERLKASGEKIAEWVPDTQAKAESITGDTVDVWRQPRLYKLSTADMTNKLAFSILSDTAYRPRDSFRWRVRALFAGKDTVAENARMELGIRYQNDSVASVGRGLAEGINELYIRTDTLPIKEVRGFVYYGRDTDSRMHTLLLYDISLMRYHALQEEAVKAEEHKQASAVQEKDTVQRIEKVDTVSEKELRPARLSPQELREQNRPERMQRKVPPQPKSVPPPANNRRRQSSVRPTR